MSLLDEILDTMDANIEFNNLDELANDERNCISKQQAEFQQDLEEIQFEMRAEEANKLALWWS